MIDLVAHLGSQNWKKKKKTKQINETSFVSQKKKKKKKKEKKEKKRNEGRDPLWLSGWNENFLPERNGNHNFDFYNKKNP